MQTPFWQVSVCVQALPSLQVVPFGLIGFEQHGLGRTFACRGLAFTLAAALPVAILPAAVGATIPQTQQKVADASTGIISAEQVVVLPCPGRDTSVDTTVTLDTHQLHGGNGIVVSIPFIPDIHMSPEVSARFRCEL